MDIPKEIYPQPEYDVKEDLKVYIRNDPMFYRKSFFPAFEDYKKNKKTTVIADMVQNGLKNYCAKFNLPFNPNELLTKEDITTVVSELIKDEMEDLSEGIMDRVKGAISSDPIFKAWKNIYKTKGENAALAYLKQNKSPEKHKQFKAMIGVG